MKLRKELKLSEVITICIGTIIGSGIYFLPTLTVVKYGLFSSLIGWLIGGLACLLIAISMFIHTKESIGISGGPVSQAYSAFGRKAGFITGWSLWISYIASLSTLAVAFADAFSEITYLKGFLIHSIAAIGIILINFGINLLGIRKVGKWQNIITVLKILPLIIFIFIAFKFAPKTGIDIGLFSLSSIGTVAAITVWAYTGFEATPIPSEEIKNPKRNIPFGTSIGILIILLIYLSIIIIVGLYLPMGSEFSGSLVEFSKSFIPSLTLLMALGILMSIGGCLNSSTLITSRILYGISKKENWKFNLNLNRFKIPHRTLYIQTILSIFLIFTGAFEQLALFTAFTYLVPYIISCLASILLIKKRKNLIFVPPGKILIPFVGFILSIWLLYESFTGLTYLQSIIALSLIFVSIPIYYIIRKK